jgi:hypothetical protein
VNPDGSTIALVDGELPSEEDWRAIVANDWLLNVLRMPQSGSDLTPLMPRLKDVRRLAVNSVTCSDLRVISELTNLRELSVGYRTAGPVDVRGLRLERFGGDPSSFPGVLDLPTLRSVWMAWDPKLGTGTAPLEDLTLSARKMTHLRDIAQSSSLRRLRLLEPRDLDLRGLARFSRLERLSIDCCRDLRGVDEILALPSLTELSFLDCVRIADIQPLAALTTPNVLIIGRNAFPQSFRDRVGSNWTFPSGRRYLPPDEDLRDVREFLVHPRLPRPLSVPDEASETLPWEDALPGDWWDLDEDAQFRELSMTLLAAISWAKKHGATRFTRDGAEVTAPKLSTMVKSGQALGEVEVWAGDRLVVHADFDLDAGVFVRHHEPPKL